MGMEEQARLAAPVTAFLAALQTRNRDLVAACLADGVTLDVPSLGFTSTGLDDVLDTIGTILLAFPDFRYRVRSRYVAAQQVTDEVLLEGTQTGPLLDSPPTGAAETIQARVMITHDGRLVTGLTVWADAAALRALVNLPGGLRASASPLVSRLRASVPSTEGKVILAQERDLATAPRETPTPVPPMTPPRARVTTRTGDLKVPVPRKVRRLQAAFLGLLMVGASAALVTWVVSGTVRTAANQPPAAALTTPSVKAPAAQRPSSTTVTSGGSQVQLQFDPGRNEFELSTDALFFDTDSADLTPAAQAAIAKVASRIGAEHRFGRITVTGYTDRRGTADHNLLLSRQRADAVAVALRRALGPLASKVSVVSVGMGARDPIVTRGTTAAELARNRRVTIQVPKATP
jgi:outer membrane protein OmpA-like peptidoglycan-associated protein/predicted ester cyclase